MTTIEWVVLAVLWATVTFLAGYGIGRIAGEHYVLFGYSVWRGKHGSVFVKRGLDGSGVSDNRNGNEGAPSVPTGKRSDIHNRPGDDSHSGRPVF